MIEELKDTFDEDVDATVKISNGMSRYVCIVLCCYGLATFLSLVYEKMFSCHYLYDRNVEDYCCNYIAIYFFIEIMLLNSWQRLNSEINGVVCFDCNCNYIHYKRSNESLLILSESDGDIQCSYTMETMTPDLIQTG